MSRAKSNEVTSPLSLFPFIGVLLSTMGALLVVLIAISRSARDSALRDVAAQRQASKNVQASAETDEERRKRQDIVDETARVKSLLAKTEQKIQEGQLRLSHVEDQMRRLEDQMASLGASAGELEDIDKGHLDDRRQAEREIERLRELIADSRETLKSLKSESAAKKRSYSIIPYEGPNGTTRRPIYIECRRDSVVVQPEGVTLTEEDLSPPIDANNALAAALCAAREHLVRNTGPGLPTKQMEPYPLILVRPDGVEAYYAVRQAISSWDADFGYEFVGSDWKLDFPPANPQLARVEHQAVEQARVRRQVLAAAAPRAFRSGGFNAGRMATADDDDDFEFAPVGRPGGTGTGSGSGFGAASRDGGSARGRSGQFAAPRGGGRGPGGTTFGQGGASGAGVVAGSTSSNAGERGGRGAGGEQQPSVAANGSKIASSGSISDLQATANGTHAGNGTLAGDPAAAVTGTPSDGAAGSNVPPGGPSPNGSAPAGAVAGGTGPAPEGSSGLNVTGGASAPTANGSQAAAAAGSMGSSQGAGLSSLPPPRAHELPEAIRSQDLAQARGANWALGGRGPAAVAVRRSIQVVVRDDRIAILPESTAPEQTSGGREIPLEGPMVNQVDDVVAAVQQQVSEWGIAGRGLYWRPVLVLHIGPDAERRAAELARLLKDSGIELRSSTAAGRTQKDSDRR